MDIKHKNPFVSHWTKPRFIELSLYGGFDVAFSSDNPNFILFRWLVMTQGLINLDSLYETKDIIEQ